ncbi:alpha/beta hydrolase fold protein [Tanacetum coccineum]
MFSNGALLQVLSGSYFSDKLPKANAIISYNNRPATEAVPYFEQLGPLVSQMMPMVEESPVSSMAKSVADAWKALLDTAEAMAPDYDPETRVSLDKFVYQLPSVFNQVKFNIDAIDETDLLEETLRPRVEVIDGTLDIVSLSGNHITPCIQDPKLILDIKLFHCCCHVFKVLSTDSCPPTVKREAWKDHRSTVEEVDVEPWLLGASFEEECLDHNFLCKLVLKFVAGHDFSELSAGHVGEADELSEALSHTAKAETRDVTRMDIITTQWCHNRENYMN